MSARRVVVTGATGFLGRHVTPVLEARYGRDAVVGVSRRQYDLTDPARARALFAELRPHVVVHLAGYVGGIEANRTWPADFLHRNLLFVGNVFQAAAEHGIDKLVYTMGGCSYPATAASPIDESQMWAGYPQPDSAAYATAKKMGIVAAEAYRQQYGLRSVVLVPGNLYGEHDNFRARESHVIPALIRRFDEAAQDGSPAVTVWGNGTAKRDFVYAGDVARLVPFFIDGDEPGPINLSSGVPTSVRTLAEEIRAATGFRGEIRWDVSKPEGQSVKIFDVRRLRALGLSCATSLRDGLAHTVAWYRDAVARAEPALRR
ncbi:MAG: NAD-dependent epimerase/dehydratase family protein [Armatimonadetes bacterium]|nr:NAD-dependent epimerase/dehydratase family protein [Armatimonadota bacterium]